MAPLRVLTIIAGLIFWSGLTLPAAAQSTTQESQRAEVDKARAAIAGQVQLAAYDLVDELAYTLIQDPVFPRSTPVVLAGVTVPVGLGTGFQALLENHINAVFTENRKTGFTLVHCPACTSILVHSTPEGTIVSRGVDNPTAMAQLGLDEGKYALFVDIEAEGEWLVLRARLTHLDANREIVWSRTLASSSSTPAMLRQPSDLKSATEAHAEYMAALRDRGPIIIPLRFTLRSYAPQRGQLTAGAPPFLWLQSGAEMSPDAGRAWTASLLMGYSFVPQAYQGLMGQARIHRLLTGRARSLTRPDLYGFVGGALMSVWGPATAVFRKRRLTADELLTDSDGDPPRNMFGGLQVGLDLRVGNRIGVSTFLESVPLLRQSPNLGEYTTVLGVEFQTLGTEVTFWF